MKILFVMIHPGYVRNYKTVIASLANRGHQVVLGFMKFPKDKDGMLRYDKLLEFKEKEKISIFNTPIPRRKDIWKHFTRPIRGTRDYIRYFDKRYKKATKLKKRLAQKIPLPIALLLEICRIPFIRFFLDKALILGENLLPTSKLIDKFLLKNKPDIVIVSPLVDFASPQTEYVKSAKKLHIKCILCVQSWDNLTNKGLIRICPDGVILWNNIQKKEAEELHNVPSSKIFVTGAQCYDKWFEGSPSRTREDFYSLIGLDNRYKYILYLCSSSFIAPQEVKFVKTWIRALRKKEDDSINNIGILIRPHPQNGAQWVGADFSEFSNVAIYPQAGENPVCQESEGLYFDSIFYSSAVIGINTSALIEAGILLKPVFTILDEQFKDTQEGTLHFHYLAKGGLLYVAKNINEHVKQLETIVNGNGEHKEKIRNFITDFVRPHGLDKNATSIVVETIENISVL